MERLLGYYLTATEVACGVLFPDRVGRVTGLAVSGAELPDLGDVVRAGAWFERELGALSLAVLLAQGRGLDRFVVCLVRNVGFQLHARGGWRSLRSWAGWRWVRRGGWGIWSCWG
ncbi:hypothetical protein GXW82_04530 [Streptacidiphilus sp. 4-A2]|nr:hypothetical protein [Streptacidiphilus sp. 4-A2]